MDRRQRDMDGLRSGIRRHGALMVAVVAMAVVLGVMGGEAWALVINTPITSPCPFTLVVPAGEDLVITSTGSIRCNGGANASGQAI